MACLESIGRFRTDFQKARKSDWRFYWSIPVWEHAYQISCCECLPMSPQPSPFPHMPAWLAAASTWVKMFSGFWSPLFSGMQQARWARSSTPPPKTGEPPAHRWGISRPHPAPRARSGIQLPLPSADMLHDAPCVGCLPFPVSESFHHVPTGICWEPISSKNLTLESWSLGLLQKELMPRYPLDWFFLCKIWFSLALQLQFSVQPHRLLQWCRDGTGAFSLYFRPLHVLPSHQPAGGIHTST